MERGAQVFIPLEQELGNSHFRGLRDVIIVRGSSGTGM